MMKIESDIVEIENSSANVFSFLSDFNNFKSMMPPQVSDWKSTVDDCSFVINGMATIGMKIVNKVPSSLINITSDGKVPFNFTLDVHITQVDENKCKGQLIFNGDINMMMKMMVEKPLTNFFNILANKMKDIK